MIIEDIRVIVSFNLQHYLGYYIWSGSMIILFLISYNFRQLWENNSFPYDVSTEKQKSLHNERFFIAALLFCAVAAVIKICTFYSYKIRPFVTQERNKLFHFTYNKYLAYTVMKVSNIMK